MAAGLQRRGGPRPRSGRRHWEAQWTEIDPHVEPVGIEQADDGRVDVEVDQVVKDLAGSVIVDSTVHHVYTFDGATILSMEIPTGE